MGISSMGISNHTPHRNIWALWGLWLVGFGIFSALYPRDISFDVAHYQIYNGWAALNGRYGMDLAPAEMHSFFNPMWQKFTWILIDHLPGQVVSFILGVLQGLILPVLYMFTKRLLRASGAQVSTGIILAIAVTGFFAEVQFGLFASTRNDSISALGFILALIFILPKDNPVPTYKALAIASFILGAFMGMKVTNIVYILGFAAAVLVVMPTWHTRIQAATICAVSGLLGIALLGGPWAWYLWQEFGNPVFPMANGIFHAPLGTELSFRDTRYLPTGIVQGLLYPFQFLFDGSLINEENFFDPRFQMTYFGAPVIIIASLLQIKKRKAETLRLVIAVSIGLLVAIVAWIFMFSIERYMAAAWLLGPSFLACLICLLRPKLLQHSKALVPTIAVCTLICMTTQTGPIRRTAWDTAGQAYVQTDLPREFNFNDSIVVFSGSYPSAFMAPAFPKSTVFTHAVVQPWSGRALDNYRPLIRKAIWENDRRLYAAVMDSGTHLAQTLERLGREEHLLGEVKSCKPAVTSFDTDGINWVICPLTRGETRPD